MEFIGVKILWQVDYFGEKELSKIACKCSDLTDWVDGDISNENKNIGGAMWRKEGKCVQQPKECKLTVGFSGRDQAGSWNYRAGVRVA